MRQATSNRRQSCDEVCARSAACLASAMSAGKIATETCPGCVRWQSSKSSAWRRCIDECSMRPRHARVRAEQHTFSGAVLERLIDQDRDHRIRCAGEADRDIVEYAEPRELDDVSRQCFVSMRQCLGNEPPGYPCSGAGMATTARAVSAPADARWSLMRVMLMDQLPRDSVNSESCAMTMPSVKWWQDRGFRVRRRGNIRPGIFRCFWRVQPIAKNFRRCTNSPRNLRIRYATPPKQGRAGQPFPYPQKERAVKKSLKQILSQTALSLSLLSDALSAPNLNRTLPSG